MPVIDEVPVVGVGPASPGVDTDKDLVVFKRRLKKAESSFSEWRDRAAQYYRAYAGDPWPEGVRDDMSRTERPPVSFNYATTTINTVLGQDQSDRKEIKFKPVDLSDKDSIIAEWFTRLVRHFYQRCQGHRHESQSHFDQLITGYGWAELWIDVTEVPFRLRITHVPTTEMLPDPSAKDDGLLDARFIIRRRDWDLEEAQARWPEKADEIASRVGIGTSYTSSTRSYTSLVKQDRNFRQVGYDSHVVTIYEYQFKRPEPWVAYIDEEGRQIQLPEKEFESRFPGVKSDKGEGPVQWLPFSKDVFYRAFLYKDYDEGSHWLEKPKEIKLDEFTYKCVTGCRWVRPDQNFTEFFGLMHLIFEIQLWIAKVLSNIIEILVRGGKGGGFIETDALENAQEFQANYSKPGYWALVKPGAIQDGKIQERQHQQFPPFHRELLQMTQNAIPQVSGVIEYLKGTATQERSNVLVTNLQGRSLISLNPFLDPLNVFRTEIGRCLSKMIQRWIPPDTIDRVLNEDPVEGITSRPMVDPETGQTVIDQETGEPVQEIIAIPSEIVQDKSVNDFDIEVDVGMASPTERQAVWNVLGQVLPEMIQTGIPIEGILPELVRFLPIPTEIAKELADDLQGKLDAQEEMQTFEGLVAVLSQMPVEQLQQVQAQLESLLAQSQPQQPPQGEQQPQQPQEAMQ